MNAAKSLPPEWRGDGWRLLAGEAADLASILPPASVDSVVTSPPYYWQRDYEVAGQLGHEATIDAYVSRLVSIFDAIRPAMTESGTVFLNLGDTYYSAKGRSHGKDLKHRQRSLSRSMLRAVDGPGLGLPRKSLIGIPWRVALAMQAHGWTLRSAVIWDRPGSMPEATVLDRPWKTYEHVFIFSTGPRYFFDRASLQGDEEVWRITSRPRNADRHAAPYPIELAERCIAAGCPVQGTVLDPFAGSGTTLAAARSLGRQSIGFDLNPDYCARAAQRIANTPSPPIGTAGDTK
jgi:DNA modification methylase